MPRSYPVGARRGRRRDRLAPVPAHPPVAGVDGLCTVCGQPEECTDVHGRTSAEQPAGESATPDGSTS